MSTDYMQSIIKQFQYYKQLGDKSFTQVNDEQLFWRSDDEANSIAIIVKHLHGNMMSRWTNFLTEDGEKTWRNRDGEFESTIENSAELLKLWEEGWSCLFSALEQVNEANFDQLIYIRNMGHTITEAINRQLCHYAYHVGQITLLARMQVGKDWKSLSIPLGSSKEYNREKFSKMKGKQHFTDEFLKKS